MSDYLEISTGPLVIQQLNRPVDVGPVVIVVTRRQAIRALLDAGLLDDIESAIAALDEPDRSRARIDWETAGEFRRDFPLLLQLGSAIGLTDADIDNLFAAAAAIV